MSKITKLLFSVSQNGNPMAKIWVDDADITKDSDSILIAIKSQVAYLMSVGVGANITLKKSNKWMNVEVPKVYEDLFDNYKVSPNETIKAFGTMLNNMFNNCFSSIEYLKNGEVTKISQEEANDKCAEYMLGYTSLFNRTLDILSKSDVTGLKAIASTLKSKTSKPADIKEANSVAMAYTQLLTREVIAKNNFVIENETEQKELVEEK